MCVCLPWTATVFNLSHLKLAYCDTHVACLFKLKEVFAIKFRRQLS